MRNGILVGLALLLPCLAEAAQQQARGDSRFVVGDIRVVGLQRITEGTVLNYLPVNVGDELTPQHVREAIKALFATGFFANVEVRRDGSMLVVVVRERPTIESFDITGNKDIKTEDLLASLRAIGLAQGKTFNRQVLEDVKAELTDQYFSHGKYGARIDARVEDLPDNLVRVSIDIDEGARAKIRQINIIGNETFDDAELLGNFELTTPRWYNWWKPGTSYSREALQGDLEKLRSFYQDRGYANFQIESAQVSISPELDDIFITVGISEGDVYRIADVRIAGNTRVPVEELRRLLLVQKGQIYSQQLISATQQLIENRLGMAGYAFAEVDPVPRLDEENKEVTLTFLVDPGKRVYVRRIEFSGMTRTLDTVLRREVRQLEGAWLSNAALERSKVRLQRLPFLEEVEYETHRVEGSDDLVDVEFKVKEGPSATISGGLGYSESSSFSLTANVVDANLFGTGRRVAIEAVAGRYGQVYGFSHTEPYATVHGVSRRVDASYSRRTQLTSTFSEFSTETWSAGVAYGLPLSETQGVTLGVTLQRLEFLTTSASSSQLWDWVRDNGAKRYLRSSGDLLIRGTSSDVVELMAAWTWDTRNRTLFPTAGALHSLSVSSTVPGSGLEYITATYQFQQYVRLPLPVLRAIPLRLSTTAGFGSAFGRTNALPPSRHWFVGGPESVRGFRESTLGARDSLGNPYGGDAALYGSAEAILPLPRKWQTSARLSLFYDFGQAFFVGDTEFYDKTGRRLDTRIDLGQLRSSTGIAVEWLSPMGLFRFSYAIPLAWQRDTGRFVGDERERFQFSIGSTF
jgi:outer membrane protein insertion porin family